MYSRGRGRGFGISGFSLGKRKSDEVEPLAKQPHVIEEEEGVASEEEEEDGLERPDSARMMKEYRDATKYYLNQQHQMNQPEPEASSTEPGGGKEKTDEEEEEEDPLDAFMSGIAVEIKKQEKVESKPKAAIRADIEEEDDQESYFKAVANAPIIILDEADEMEIEYDDDGNPIIPESAKFIDPLPPVDHLDIDYPSFTKNFYDEDESIKALSKAELVALRKKLSIRVSGFTPPRPCVSFAHFGFDERMMNLIRKSEFSTPTPIQAQSIPAGLSGRDVIGVAKTGSGKTLAYLWPLLIHAAYQPELKENDGPIGLILTPTRELCQQIYHQAKKFSKAYNLTSCCVYGGGNRYEQTLALKEGCEILVATPGRLIDLVKAKATNLLRVTYLVFDEADRMFDMGFEQQVRSIANHVRPDRQTLLFSATFRKKVERLCRDILTDPVRVVIGDLGEANTDVTQLVQVVSDATVKWHWLLSRLVEFVATGGVLVFVTKKVDCEGVATSLRQGGFRCGLIHGDMGQSDRDDVITQFKKQLFPILVATDVAARGLDIPSIKTVVNYDVAKNIDTHVHRIGRTGRAGEKGVAHTLVLPKDVSFAGDLVRNMEVADQVIPDELLQLAMQNARFRSSRARSGRKGGGAIPNRKARPGLGLVSASSEAPSGPKQKISVSSRFVPAATTGPSGDRSSSLKEAMQASYKVRFQSASGSSFSSTSSLSGTSSANTSTTTKKRKSRWD